MEESTSKKFVELDISDHDIKPVYAVYYEKYRRLAPRALDNVYGDEEEHVLHVHKQNGENVSPAVRSFHVESTPVIASPKEGQKKEDGWIEVVGQPIKSKKMQVPSAAIGRVIGRGGCNINAIREVSGAHIEVDDQRGSVERVITIKGTVEGTKQAHTLISALIADPGKDLHELIPQNKYKTSTKDQSMFFNPETVMPPASTHGQTSTSNMKKTASTRNMGPRGQNQSSSARPPTTVCSSAPSSSKVWEGARPQLPITSLRRSKPKQTSVHQPGQSNTGKNVTRQLFPNETKNWGGFGVPPSTSSDTTVSYSLAASTSKVTTSGSPVFPIKPDSGKQPIPSKPGQIRTPMPDNVKVLQHPGSHKQEPQPLPIISGQLNGPTAPPIMGPNRQFLPTSSPAGSFSPFNNLFSKLADQLFKKNDGSERMNFASVAATGVIGSPANASATSDLVPTKVDPQLQAKAPGFRHVMPTMMTNEMDCRMFQAELSPHSSTSIPNTNMSPQNQTNASLDSGHISSAVDQKVKYTTPSEPMTLPKIEMVLNPNAPPFKSRLQPRDGNSSGPIRPLPSAASPLAVSPQLSDQMMSEDWRSDGQIGGERRMGPIGGERAQRRAQGPVPAPPISGPVGDGMQNNMWNPQMKGQVSEASDKMWNF